MPVPALVLALLLAVPLVRTVAVLLAALTRPVGAGRSGIGTSGALRPALVPRGTGRLLRPPGADRLESP
ncbi:hypothetical protein [Streptomyces sp. NPDC001758]